MASTLNLYKGNELIDSAESKDGVGTVTITGLEPDTEYSKGEYQVAWENDSGESEKVDVPAFKTNSIGVTKVNVSDTAITLEVDQSKKVDANVEPDNATDKTVTFSSSNEDVAIVDEDGNISGVAEGTTIVRATNEPSGVSTEIEVTVEAATPEEPGDVDVEPGEEDADVSVEE